MHTSSPRIYRKSKNQGSGVGGLDTPAISTKNQRMLPILKHHHHNNEYHVDNYNYNNNIKNTVPATHTQERSISSPCSNRSGVHYHQLYFLFLQSILVFRNYSSFLKTISFGMLLNHIIAPFFQNLALPLLHTIFNHKKAP